MWIFYARLGILAFTCIFLCSVQPSDLWRRGYFCLAQAQPRRMPVCRSQRLFCRQSMILRLLRPFSAGLLSTTWAAACRSQRSGLVLLMVSRVGFAIKLAALTPPFAFVFSYASLICRASVVWSPHSFPNGLQHALWSAEVARGGYRGDYLAARPLRP